MKKEELYKVTDILNDVLSNYLRGSEAEEVIAKLEESVENSELIKEEPVSYKAEDEIVICLNGKRHKQVLHKGTFSKNECMEKCSLYERCQNCSIDLCMIFFHDNHCHFVEELISEEFEKALAEEWQGYVDRGAATVDALEDNTQELAFAKGFYRGANWQKVKDQETIETAIHHAYHNGKLEMKEEMLAKAVDGDITFDYYGDDDKTYGCIAHDSFCLEDFGLKDRDKVKVILIKEE